MMAVDPMQENYLGGNPERDASTCLCADGPWIGAYGRVPDADPESADWPTRNLLTD